MQTTFLTQLNLTTNKIYEQVEQVRLDLKNSIDIKKEESKNQKGHKEKKENSED